MRIRPLLWLLLLVWAPAGCGAHGAMAERSRPASAGMAAPAPAPPDVDGDGVPDKADMAASEDEPAPAALRDPGFGQAAPAENAPKDTTSAPRASQKQLLVYTARLTLAVYQIEQGLSAVEASARELGGYLSSRGDREITVRVPRARFQEAIQHIEGTGQVLHREVQAEDVSDEFYDLEVRLKNARALRDRLQELLTKAQVKDALEIEKELNRVTLEIERIEGTLKALGDKISYSTISVSFAPRGSTVEGKYLPFSWLKTLGLPALLRLNEEK